MSSNPIVGNYLMQKLEHPYKPISMNSLKEADAIVVLTEWDEYRQINWKEIVSKMRKPAWIFDTRIILDRKELREIVFRVWTVGNE